jgi:hypothetical protein
LCRIWIKCKKKVITTNEDERYKKPGCVGCGKIIKSGAFCKKCREDRDKNPQKYGLKKETETFVRGTGAGMTRRLPTIKPHKIIESIQGIKLMRDHSKGDPKDHYWIMHHPEHGMIGHVQVKSDQPLEKRWSDEPEHHLAKKAEIHIQTYHNPNLKHEVKGTSENGPVYNFGPGEVHHLQKDLLSHYKSVKSIDTSRRSTGAKAHRGKNTQVKIKEAEPITFSNLRQKLSSKKEYIDTAVGVPDFDMAEKDLVPKIGLDDRLFTEVDDDNLNDKIVPVDVVGSGRSYTM